MGAWTALSRKMRKLFFCLSRSRVCYNRKLLKISLKREDLGGLNDMEKKIVSDELEEISRWFLSSSRGEGKEASKANESEERPPHPPESESEIDESVSVRRRISFPNSQRGQNEMKACLLSHLQENYLISRVELKRTSDHFQPKAKRSTKEEVLLYLKDSL